MPNLGKLNNLNGGKMPEIPPGMKIEDLKDAFYNLPPNMKDRLNEMAQCTYIYTSIFQLWQSSVIDFYLERNILESKRVFVNYLSSITNTLHPKRYKGILYGRVT